MAESANPLTYHLINPGRNAITDALFGIAAANPDELRHDATFNVLYRADQDERRKDTVSLVAAAGGGHEPMFGGFVGRGALSAFVAGNVFAAPTGKQILAGIRRCHGRRGTVLVTNNYTGDILNCGMAMTRARAEGMNVRLVVIADDVAVGRAKGGKVGRRGLCGYLSALKVACALAEQGKDLDEVAAAAEWIAGRVGTVAVAFDRCALPTSLVTPLNPLPPHTIELGMGAHGEPGLMSLSPVPEPEDLVQRMMQLLTDQTDADRAFVDLEPGDQVVLVLNSLGSTGDEVLLRFANLAVSELHRLRYSAVRVLYGPLVTSLNMSGVGMSIGRLPREGEQRASVVTPAEFLECWDLPTSAVSWPATGWMP